jgi:hypothetical protein
VSAAEFEQMKRELDIERESAGRTTSTRAMTKRLAHIEEPTARGAGAAGADRADGADGADAANAGRAPDVPENEGVAPAPKPKRPAKSRPRNRRHGRRR